MSLRCNPYPAGPISKTAGDGTGAVIFRCVQIITAIYKGQAAIYCDDITFFPYRMKFPVYGIACQIQNNEPACRNSKIRTVRLRINILCQFDVRGVILILAGTAKLPLQAVPAVNLDWIAVSCRLFDLCIPNLRGSILPDGFLLKHLLCRHH